MPYFHSRNYCFMASYLLSPSLPFFAAYDSRALDDDWPTKMLQVSGSGFSSTRGPQVVGVKNRQWLLHCGGFPDGRSPLSWYADCVC